MMDYDELTQMAEAATPGPWYTGDNYLIGGLWIFTNPDNPRKSIIIDLINNDADAEYVATFDPPTVLALLAAARERDSLAAEVEELRAAVRMAYPDIASLSTTMASNWVRLPAVKRALEEES